MKLCLIALTFIVGLTFGQDPGIETVYQVIDQTGNLILETTDSNVVKQMNHVKVKVTAKPVKLVTLANDTTADELKSIFERHLGAPEKVQTYYTITWKTPNGGTLILNKHPTVPRAVLICSYKAQMWARDNIPALSDDLKDKEPEKPKEKHIPRPLPGTY
jgi:hypothetical protein